MDTTNVSADDVRAFAARACATAITGSPLDRSEYERLRSKLFAACHGDPKGLDRVTAVTGAVRTCLTAGHPDGRTLARLRRSVDRLVNHFA